MVTKTTKDQSQLKQNNLSSVGFKHVQLVLQKLIKIRKDAKTMANQSDAYGTVMISTDHKEDLKDFI